MTAPLIVGYTATPAGADAVALGARIAAATGAEVRLVLVLPEDGHGAVPDASYDGYVRGQAREWLRGAAELLPDDVRRTAHVRTAESFAEGLVAAAREFSASLIVVGAANGGLRGRHRLGTVASELLHSSDVPVALAPGGSSDVTEPISRVTVAVGTRPGAAVLVEESVALAASTRVPVRLVSLVTTDLPPGLDTGAIRIAGSTHADEVLAAVREELPDGLHSSAVVATAGSVEDAVAGLDWLPGELVTVGSSRLARPRFLFLGSTAAKMLHELPVPMVVGPHPASPSPGSPARARERGTRPEANENSMSENAQRGVSDPVTTGISTKGLSAGAVGLIGAVVIGISCIAPAYTFTAAVGPTTSAVGTQVPAIILVGFIPMLLVAFGYRELNNRMPDSGTSFTWATRAFGPWAGWMAGWGLIVATILVLSNLAGIAVDFLFLLIAQVSGNPQLALLTDNPFINVGVCLLFMLGATFVSYRDMQTTQRLQYVLVSFQLLVLVLFAGAAIVRTLNGDAFDATAFDWSWFNPFAVPTLSAAVAGLSLSIFIFWGWDVTLTMNEETKDPERTPGRAATLTVLTIVAVYLLLSIGLMMFAGIGDGEYGLGNPDIQENVFFALSGQIMGPFAFLVSLAVLTSSASSLQSTFVSPARTLLAMGHYGALPSSFAKVHPRFFTPGRATIVASVVASVFYAVMRFVSYNVLWDTILALGMMICFYYGLTAFACVWYFRRQWFDSARSFLFTFLFPLVGGTILGILFVITLIDSADPGYSDSGSNIGGVGLVFILGVSVIVLGVVIMIWQAVRRPEFFRGRVLTAEAPPSARRLRDQLPSERTDT